jgi:hypothetical protein
MLISMQCVRATRFLEQLNEAKKSTRAVKTGNITLA